MKRFLLRVSLAAFAFLAVHPTDSEALGPARMSETTYYSDATHQVEVGGRITHCNGTASSWGVVTRYRVTVLTAPCPL